LHLKYFRVSRVLKKSDIYSLGMIMWELTICYKPFAYFKHNILIYGIIDGKWPEITYNTPECFAKLMKRCWNSDPSKRPTIKEIHIMDCFCRVWYDQRN